MGAQDKKNASWTLDSTAVAYENKKKGVIAALDKLQTFHTDLATLHEENKFGFGSYGYLNPETILCNKNGSHTFFDPAPLIIRDIFKEEQMHRDGNAETHRITDSMYPEKYLPPAVRAFSKTQRASEDLYSMAMIWEKTFNLDVQNYTNGPYDDALLACITPKNRKTSGQLQKDLTKDTTYTLDDVEKLCSGRAGEKELIEHVEKCSKNPQACQASPKLILETAAMLLSQKKDSFAQSAKAWS